MRSTSTTCPDRRCRHAGSAHRGTARAGSLAARARQAGFTLVSVVFLLVVLAALGAALASVGVRQQMGSAAEIEAARALQAARAGLEWAAFQVLRSPPPPGAAPGCFGDTSFVAAGLAGFTVTVRCARTDGVDGATTLAFYQLVANACNGPVAGACPNPGASPRPTYVERQLTWMVTR